MVNGLGGTPISELYLLYGIAHQRLADKGIKVFRSYVNEYCTSLEMAGASITLLKVNDELKELLLAPAEVVQPGVLTDARGRGERRGGGRMPGAPHVRHAPGHDARLRQRLREASRAGRPARLQPVVERLLARGSITGAVLDAGCGYRAGRRAASPRTGATWSGARRRRAGGGAGPAAGGRAGVASRPVVVGDALDLATATGVLAGPFDTVLDVGLFHVAPARRPRALRRVPGIASSGPGARRWSVAWGRPQPVRLRPGARHAAARSGPRSGARPGGASEAIEEEAARVTPRHGRRPRVAGQRARRR